jgi:hypothetical protein
MVMNKTENVEIEKRLPEWAILVKRLYDEAKKERFHSHR